jgi:nitroreductase
VIESPNILERVKKSYVRSWFDDVPLVLAVVGNKNEVWQRKYDGYNSLETDLSIAMDHMILAASALGIGSCWIANFEPEVLRGALQLKEDQEIFAITPLGYPKEGGSEEVKEKTRKKLGDIMRMI